MMMIQNQRWNEKQEKQLSHSNGERQFPLQSWLFAPDPQMWGAQELKSPARSNAAHVIHTHVLLFISRGACLISFTGKYQNSVFKLDRLHWCSLKATHSWSAARITAFEEFLILFYLLQIGHSAIINKQVRPSSSSIHLSNICCLKGTMFPSGRHAVNVWSLIFCCSVTVRCCPETTCRFHWFTLKYVT